MINLPKLQKKQSGVVLVISLVMLLLLTLIGVTATQVTSLEEKMAGNAKNYNIAFQAAETTLRGAEAYVETLVTTSSFDGTNGLYGEVDTDPNYLNSSSWGSTVSVASARTFSDIPAAYQPRFIIKYIVADEPNLNAKLNIGGYGESTAGGQATIFRVTSKSTGITGRSQVVLQSYYAKRF